MREAKRVRVTKGVHRGARGVLFSYDPETGWPVVDFDADSPQLAGQVYVKVDPRTVTAED